MRVAARIAPPRSRCFFPRDTPLRVLCSPTASLPASSGLIAAVTLKALSTYGDTREPCRQGSWRWGRGTDGASAPLCATCHADVVALQRHVQRFVREGGECVKMRSEDAKPQMRAIFAARVAREQHPILSPPRGTRRLHVQAGSRGAPPGNASPAQRGPRRDIPLSSNGSAKLRSDTARGGTGGHSYSISIAEVAERAV